MLFSKERVMRSGYVHPTVQHDFVISGRVEVWILTTTGTEKRIYGEESPHGKWFTIPPYVPHLLHFVSDSIVVEWWEKGLSESSSTSSTDSNSTATTTTSSNSDDTPAGDQPLPPRRTSVARRDTQCWYYHPYRNVVDVHRSVRRRRLNRSI